jgi:plastocyanin
VAVAMIAAAAAGCGSGGSSESGSPTVSMSGLRFHPASLKVKVGDKVTWTNDDTPDHNVTSTSGAHFMSKAFPHGRSYSYTPRKAGTIKYVCTLHPGMVGKLIVTK